MVQPGVLKINRPCRRRRRERRADGEVQARIQRRPGGASGHINGDCAAQPVRSERTKDKSRGPKQLWALAETPVKRSAGFDKARSLARHAICCGRSTNSSWWWCAQRREIGFGGCRQSMIG